MKCEICNKYAVDTADIDVTEKENLFQMIIAVCAPHKQEQQTLQEDFNSKYNDKIYTQLLLR